MNTSTRIQTRRLIATLAASALFATACGGDDDDAAEPSVTASPDGSTVGEPDPDEPADTDAGSADEQPPDGVGESLVVAIGNEPETLDIGQLRAGTDYYPAVNIFEQLITRDVDGELVPGLAESWEVSDDGTAFTFELRQDVEFHNGDPMTAEDVAYSFERFVDPEMGNVFAYLLGGLREVEVVDEYTVTVHLEEFDGAFLGAGGYAYIVPKGYIEDVGTDEFAENPVGTGPFTFASRSIGEGFQLQRFDGYWGEPAGYEEIEFRIIGDDNARVSALRSDQVDLIAQVPPQNIDQLESDGDIDVRTAVTGDNIFLHFNGRVEGPWNDPDVRRALSLAVDQQAIRDVAIGGLAVPLAGISALNFGYEDTDVVERDYDPDLARQLLEDAGHGDGFSIEIWGPVNGRLPNSEQLVQAVAGYWNEIGVDVDVNIIEYSQWVDVQSNPSEASGAIFGLWGDAQTFDPQARMLGSLTCEGPYSHICDDEIEEMMEAVQTTVDPDERIAAYEEVFRYVQDNALVLYLYTAEGAFAMADDVDWQPWHGTPYTRMVNAHPA